MLNDKEYYAFISYSHKDEEWAKWLQHEFEHYHLPTTLNGVSNLPDKFRPIFRDVDELSGGELKPQISYALRSSAYLVIICSPNSAKSPYVNDEIREFVEIGKELGVDNVSNIFPFIVDGIPHSKENPRDECFPQALIDLPTELIAGDVTKHGREHAFVKILSGTLQKSHIGFSTLWNQFERDRIESERREREKRDKLLLLESRYLSEKALDVAHEDSQLAKMLVLRALPEDLIDFEDRPYCIEAESALRIVYNYRTFHWKVPDAKFIRLLSNKDVLVSCSRDGAIMLWDVVTGKTIGAPILLRNGIVADAVLNRSGKVLAIGYEDGNIILSNIQTNQLVTSLDANFGIIKSLLFTNDDNLLIIRSESAIWIWDIENGCLYSKIHETKINGIAIDNNNQWMALAAYSPFAIKIYDLKSKEKIKEISKAHSESLISVNFSPDGKKIVSAAYDGKFKVWDWMNDESVLSKIVGRVSGAYGPIVYSAQYDKDGKSILTVSQDNVIRIWDAVSGKLDRELVENTNSCLQAVFNTDNNLIISKYSDNFIRIWDFVPKVPYKIVGRARAIGFDEYTMFGNIKLIKSKCDIKITDILNGEIIRTLKGHKKNVADARFSPDGTKIVSASYDGTAKIWDFNTGEQIGGDYIGHTEYPISAAFSPDGKLIITASFKEIKVWDVETSMQLGMDLTCFEDFNNVMFSKDGRIIIAETENDYDVAYDWLPVRELIDKAKQQVNSRQFTDAEKKKYYID